ncbi:conserved hypothetical protein [Methylocella tundrae]|uniref:hypothetical protein n=1 Tax=Methylocella tundrae TaxID=227605 RepID=UPI001311AA92|nr:hypothetical protein [Methylocella tundrae]VTZ25635.1 conserved hypothetical protein [Methylocella tundrae]
MALVTELVGDEIKRPKLHPTQVPCYWSILTIEGAEAPILQLDTRGSAERETPQKQSQTLQFDRHSATQLFLIIKREFNL